MKQSDILSFAINGVRRELREAEEVVANLELVLEDLLAIEEKDAIGRPAGFVAEPLINHDRK